MIVRKKTRARRVSFSHLSHKLISAPLFVGEDCHVREPALIAVLAALAVAVRVSTEAEA